MEAAKQPTQSRASWLRPTSGDAGSALGAAFMAIVAPIGALLLIIVSWRTRSLVTSRAMRGWLVAWSPLLLLGAVHAVLPAGDFWLLLHAGMGLAAGLLLSAPRRAVATGLLVGSACLAAGFMVERWVAATTWAGPAEPAFTAERLLGSLGRETRTGTLGLTSLERRWTGVAEQAAVLEFDARILEGEPGWYWFRNDPAILLAAGGEPGSRLTRVTPASPSSATVSRRADTGAALAGRTFRVELVLRAAEAYSASARECRGVLLREVGGGRAAGCFAESYSQELRSYSFAWTAPQSAATNLIGIELKLPVTWYEVGEVTLHERVGDDWLPVSPLEPEGARISLADPPAPAQSWSGAAFVPAAEWQHFTVPVARSASHSDVSRILLRLEPGVTVQTRSVVLRGSSGAALAPAASPERGQAWLGHPNSAGHAAAVIALAAAATAAAPLPGTVSLGVGLVSIALTGSRTALLGLAIGSVLLLTTLLRRASPARVSRLLGLGLLIGVALALLTQGSLLKRIGELGVVDGNTVTREAIWQVAAASFRAQPLTGLAGRSFTDAWNDAAATQTAAAQVPPHAHNLLLQMAAQFGVPGLVATVWLCGALLISARRLAGMRGLALTLAVLAMQMTDFTFFNSPVLLTLVLALNALGAARLDDPQRAELLRSFADRTEARATSGAHP